MRPRVIHVGGRRPQYQRPACAYVLAMTVAGWIISCRRLRDLAQSWRPPHARFASHALTASLRWLRGARIPHRGRSVGRASSSFLLHPLLAAERGASELAHGARRSGWHVRGLGGRELSLAT